MWGILERARMMFSLSWGYWEEDWRGGSFHCVFRKSATKPDDNGMVQFAGLYRATDGEVLTDMDTFQQEISHREVIAFGKNGQVRVRAEMADQIAVAIAESFGRTHHSKPSLAHIH
jgi:hypothetical protein